MTKFLLDNTIPILIGLGLFTCGCGACFSVMQVTTRAALRRRACALADVAKSAHERQVAESEVARLKAQLADVSGKLAACKTANKHLSNALALAQATLRAQSGMEARL